jgi:hypothetical protein
MLRLSSTAQLVDALQRSRTVDVQAYTLCGKVLQALEGASRRGARVRVRLEADPAADARGRFADHNRKLVAAMRDAGVDATLASHVHAKAIDADGTLFLDEKNFDGDGDLVLCDDNRNDPAIATRKSDALAAEASMLRSNSACNDVIVESETFGATAVSNALREIAREGGAPRLLVSDRSLRGNAGEREQLESLAAAGVRVRVCKDSAKLAAAGERAWAGSANATPAWGRYDMTDWGVRTDDPAIRGAIRERLENCWSSARPF